MKILNLTPHAVTFLDASNNVICEIEPSGVIARVGAKTIATGEIINDIPVTTTQFSEVEDLPDPVEGVVYIVSSLVAQRRPFRKDIFIPNEVVRNSAGVIIGCRSLGQI